jgi:Replication Fork Protection Component Swi3
MSKSRLDDLFDGDTEEDEPKLIGLKRSSDDVIKNDEDGNPIEELLKKTVKRKRVFTEDILTGCDGLVRIYEDFPREKLFMGRGYELQDMKRLLHRYKEWGFQMFPGLAFPDLLNRCETFGPKARTRVCLKVLRDRERDRFVVRLNTDKMPSV